MNNKRTLYPILLIIIFFVGCVSAQINIDVVQKVANHIIDNTSYKIINKETKELFDNTECLDVAKQYKIESPYNQWHYWNGVLANGMVRFSEVTGKLEYKQYALKNYQFIFNNLDYFEKQYNAGIKWASLYLFYRMSKLDDCGAMSAGLCNVYQHDKKQEYFDF